MLFGRRISIRFSGCKYILPPSLSLSLSPSLSLYLCLSLCACMRQTSGAQCSELIKGFIPLPGSSRIAIWTLFIHKCCPGNNVYFYYHLGGEKRQIRMQSLSAHIAFHEIKPLQECFEEAAIFQTTSLQPQVIHQQLSSPALSPSSDA